MTLLPLPPLPPLPKSPVTFTPELAAAICARLAEGLTLREVCKLDGMPDESAVRQWALNDREGFAALYARAREIGYLAMADELLEIADDSSGDRTEAGVYNAEFVNRSRLKIDTRKWLLSKCLPKIYGDKIAVTGEDGGSLKIKIERIERVLVPAKKPEAES